MTEFKIGDEIDFDPIGKLKIIDLQRDNDRILLRVSMCDGDLHIYGDIKKECFVEYFNDQEARIFFA